MLRTLCGLLCLATPLTALAEDTPNTREALTKASRFLQDDMQTWRSERKCGACHHAPPALWTLSELQRQHIPVAPGYITELVHWIGTDDNARLLPAEPTTEAQFSLAAVYLSQGLNALTERSPEVETMRQRLVKHLQLTQAENGSWNGPAGRPPVFAPPVEVTLLVLVTWQPHQSEFPELSPMLTKAANWVSAQPVGDSQQEIALRLIWAARQSDTATAASLKSRLLEQQQSDGGWRQQADFPSDAFATGQVLVALRAADVPGSHPAIQRGVQFLCRTQGPDGSWPMKSRPHPENGSSARNLNPITYAGTAWAVSGLLAACE